MDDTPEQTTITDRDVLGAWLFGANRVDLLEDGSFLTVTPCLRQEGTFKVTLGTRFGHGRWTSRTGYFLQLDPKAEPDKFNAPQLFQIKQLLPDSMTLQSPRKNNDGEYVYPAFICPRDPSSGSA